MAVISYLWFVFIIFIRTRKKLLEQWKQNHKSQTNVKNIHEKNSKHTRSQVQNSHDKN
jgi:hypothetical protein